ncbi:AbrB/MazE/SpoVT family DNA-binding domain-containing protein [Robertmurraya kyonggiensis]|uniref:AbrB/MazE/SpoVT family DNA-binding domain-containing protein n=1 Tax=Robertmurraya kyonggiensis TaxID=1037680 RepID=A0A4U1D083_9BACI|nr:AbrB/MazE/SpoVT family DNA-binding domain-containing protein [Robertmurraya kyonggiensis]TKC15705.1 AbrB/MazE/SpoVT family DNA-binding domain-containing protein [Robertmurraya kyonggiensis]
MKLKGLGIVRKIDELGRIVIPKEVRDVNAWGPGTSMEMFSTEDGLVIKKYKRDEEKASVVTNLKAALNGEQLLNSEDLRKAIAFIEQK